MMLHHHLENDFVALRDGSATRYLDTVANFERDYRTKVPPLPAGAHERIYDQNVRHTIAIVNSVIGGPLPWPDGDAIIAQVDSGIAAKNAREQADQAAAQAAADAQFARLRTADPVLQTLADLTAKVERLQEQVAALQQKGGSDEPRRTKRS